MACLSTTPTEPPDSLGINWDTKRGNPPYCKAQGWNRNRAQAGPQGSLEKSLTALPSPARSGRDSARPPALSAGEQLQGPEWAHKHTALDPGAAPDQLPELGPVIEPRGRSEWCPSHGGVEKDSNGLTEEPSALSWAHPLGVAVTAGACIQVLPGPPLRHQGASTAGHTWEGGAPSLTLPQRDCRLPQSPGFSAQGLLSSSHPTAPSQKAQ